MAPRVDKRSRAKRKGKQEDIENEIQNYELDSDTAQDIEQIDVQASSRPSTACTNQASAEETPVSKKLRLEDELREKTQNTTSSFPDKIKSFSRPESHGNESALSSFAAKIGIQQSLPIVQNEQIPFSFAPAPGKAHTSRVVTPEQSISQQLPTSHQPDTTTPDTHPSNPRSSADRATSFAQAAVASVISQRQATTAQPRTVEYTQAVEFQDQATMMEDYADTGEQASVHDDENFNAPVMSIEDGPTLTEAENGGHDHNEEMTLVDLDQTLNTRPDPATPRQPRAKSSVPLTARGRLPARISKTKPPVLHTGTDVSKLPSNTTDAPSEQELFCMLMFSIEKNKAERDQLVSKGKAKIKTLVHYYKQMRQEKQDVEAALERSESAHVEAVDREKSLEAAIETFKARFKKLSDYASTMQADHEALRTSAAGQVKALNDLRDSEREREATIQQVRNTMQKTQSTMKRHKAELRAMRDASLHLLSQLDDVKKDLDQRSGQLQDERRKNQRLEGHIVDLQNTQRRSSHVAKEGNDRINKSLTDLAEHFCKFDLLLLQKPEIPQAFGECVDLVRDLHARDHVTPTDFSQISNRVALLQDSVSEGVGVVNGLITRETPDQSVTSLGAAVAQLQASVDALRPDLSAAQSEREARIRAEARLAGKDETIESIQQARADSQSSIATFQEAAEAVNKDSQRRVDAAEAESRRSNESNNVLNTKWARARSDLAATQGKLERAGRLTVALGHLVEIGVARVDHETSQRRALGLSVRGQLDRDSNQKQELVRLKAQIAQLEDAERTHNAIVTSTESERDTFEADLSRNTLDLSATRKSLEEQSGEATRLKTEVISLQTRKQLDDQELQRLKAASAELETAKCEHESTLLEVTGLKKKLLAADTTSADLAALTKRTRKRETEFELLQSELNEARTTASKVPQLKQNVDKLSKEKSELENWLEQATTDVTHAGVLRSQIREKDVELTELHDKISELTEVQEQLQESRLVKQKLKQQLDAAKDRLAAIEAELQSKDHLEIDLQQREAQVVELQEHVKKAGEIAAELEATQVQYQLKDEQMASLQREVQRFEEEAQEAQHVLEGLPQHVVDVLLSHEPFRARLQHRGRTTCNAPKTGEDGHHETEPDTGEADSLASQRPRRRAANRSVTNQVGAYSRAAADGGHLPQADLPDEVDVVPDSQQIVVPKGSLGPSAQKEVLERSSQLSDPPEDEALEQDLQDVADGASHIDGRETRMKFSQESRMSAPMHRHSSELRPSSSMSVDLFRQHASGLSGPSRVRKFPQPADGSPGLEPSETDHGHPDLSPSSGSSTEELEITETYEMPETIDPAVLEPSPRRLRDGTQLGLRLTSLPEPSANPRNLTTPARVQERHQPNSAAKRSAQDEPERPHESTNGKKQRLKRKPENLDLPPAVRSSMLGRPSSQLSSSGQAVRKGGSVIGTSAPTPGKSQRSTKSSKKTKRTSNYAARFNDNA